MEEQQSVLTIDAVFVCWVKTKVIEVSYWLGGKKLKDGLSENEKQPLLWSSEHSAPYVLDHQDTVQQQLQHHMLRHVNCYLTQLNIATEHTVYFHEMFIKATSSAFVPDVGRICYSESEVQSMSWCGQSVVRPSARSLPSHQSGTYFLQTARLT